MRERPLLLVLDEPTAALDAETEHALFERYAAAARGRGRPGHIILVSTELDGAHADLIVVLDGARLVEVRHARGADGRGGQSPSCTGSRRPPTIDRERFSGGRSLQGWSRIPAYGPCWTHSPTRTQ
jgi:ABC-type multidrug transport system ATPase subunit